MIFKHITDLVVDWGDKLVLVVDSYSFNVCLLIGLIALVLSVFGYEKGKKVATISPAVYVILQIFMKVWFGV